MLDAQGSASGDNEALGPSRYSIERSKLSELLADSASK